MKLKVKDGFFEDKKADFKGATDIFGAMKIVEAIKEAGYEKEAKEMYAELREELEHYEDIVNSQQYGNSN